MKLDILKGHWVDMIFEGRNKAYGAFELRKENPKTTMIALLLGSVLFAGLVASQLVDFKALGKKEEDVTLAKMAKLAPPPPPPPAPKVPPPPPPPPAPKISEVKFVKPKVVKKEEATEELAHVDELKKNNVGTENVKGKEDGQLVVTGPSGDGPKEEKIIEDNTIYNAVEVSADFPGGLSKFGSYVAKNFQTPEDSEEMNVRIILTFVVEKDGNLTDIKVVRGFRADLDKEAIRVLKACPKWKPGVQNGKNVRSTFTLPINVVVGG